MKYRFAPVDELGDDRVIHYGVYGVVEIRIAFEVLDVENRPRAEVVYDIDLVTVLQQSIRQVRAYEAGSSRNQ